MATIKAFKAVRPIPEKAADVAALPYDVYNREEAATEVRGKYDSFLRVDRPESTLDHRINPYDPFVYEQAAKNLEKLYDRKVIAQDDRPCLYLYELVMDGRSQVGLVACTAVDEYLDNTIKKHELTREDKEQDRIKHVNVCDANTGPIFLTYRSQEAINKIIEDEMKKEPVYNFTSDDDVTHRVWVIDDQTVIEDLTDDFKKVPNFYIADGHHRSASAVKVGLMRREQHPDYTGNEEFNFFLSVLFPDEQLKIMDYNRVVKDLNGMTTEEFLKALEEKFIIEEKGIEAVKPIQKGTFGMCLDGKWFLLTAKEGSYNAEDPVESLDVAILQNNVLVPILGIKDIRTDKRIDFVGGIRGLEELGRRVNTDMQLAFSMYPTSIEELMSIADADLLMPPKSTWFEPKLRSGLFIHKLD
ncbi:MAG: DUF1015 family protein [Eubacterium sp.]